MRRRSRKQRVWIQVGPVEVLEPSAVLEASEARWMWSFVGAVALLGLLGAMAS